MRGAVSGGMAAAICCLGLSNAFDSIYGSSAGSIIGSYFVSRQLYLDVYTDVIPAGKDLFVSKGKILGDVLRNLWEVMKGPLGKKLMIERFWNPAPVNDSTFSSIEALPPTRAGGLNISFVLDSIMCPKRGLRPLDLESFSHNDAVQPLRIVSSAVELETGRLKTICFGSKEGHFRDEFANPDLNGTAKSSLKNSTNLYPEIKSAEVDEHGYRRGLWACLGASMTVPGAAGSPIRMDLPSIEKNQTTPHLCFDAFCYEPVPFRSAVAEGATHVLALRSRPAGFEPKTKPTLYERAVAPLYFRSHGLNTVAEFFEKGGQQYLYAEDVLTCDEGLDSTEPIPIPPVGVLYAAPAANNLRNGPSQEPILDKDRKNWARAHLLPITVAADVPELSTLSQDRDDILAGIRSGFAAAYDMLSPVVGLETGPGSMDGKRVAELVFPEADVPHESVLEQQLELPGEKLDKGIVSAGRNFDVIISAYAKETPITTYVHFTPPARGSVARLQRWLSSKQRENFSDLGDDAKAQNICDHGIVTPMRSASSTPRKVPGPHLEDAATLLSHLPGIKLGRLPLVSERLQNYLGSDV